MRDAGAAFCDSAGRVVGRGAGGSGGRSAHGHLVDLRGHAGGRHRLLPIPLFPLLGVMDGPQVTTNYGNHLIFLFLGGFWIAVTMEKWQLHRRLALHIIRRVGGQAHRVVLGFMLATAFLSMWLSNTATAMMMLPIAMAVAGRADEGDGRPRAVSPIAPSRPP